MFVLAMQHKLYRFFVLISQMKIDINRRYRNRGPLGVAKKLI